jgi:hypothetical protein
MSLAPFDKDAFQYELRDNIERMLAEDQTVSTNQLVDFLEYFQAQRPILEDLTVNLNDQGFRNTLRVVMIYATLAMSLQEQAVYAAALETFPLDEVPAQWAALAIEVLDHIRDTPSSETREFFTHGLPGDQTVQRIQDLRNVLTGRFAETL